MPSQQKCYPFLKNYYSSYQGLSSFVWQGIIISFIESTLVGVCYFLSLYFVNELHLSVASAGMIISFYGAGTILGGLLGGKLSDQLSPKIVSVSCLLLQSIAYLILIKATQTPLLMLNLFILGIGSYGFITSNHVATLAHCRTSSERLKAINILGAASNLGLAISGLIIGLLATQHFIYIFMLSSFSLCATAIYLITQNEAGSNQILITSDIHHATSSNPLVTYFVLSSLFLVGFIISQMNVTYPLYLQQIFPEMGTKSFSILLTLNAIIVVLFQAPIVNHLGNLNKILLAGAGAFLLGLGMTILNISYFFWIAILSCLLTTLGEILFFSVSQLICYENGPKEKKGHSLGIYRMVFASSRMIGPVTGGLLYQQYGGYVLWYICFFFGVLCLMPTSFLRKKYT